LRTRAAFTALALVGAALPGRLRRRPRPAAVADAAVPADPGAPTQRVFESTATSFDGTSVRVVATASPGNQAFGARTPGQNDREPEPAGSLSIAEGSGHPAEQRGRPITWAVVAFISMAFVAIGLGLVYSVVWLFIAGVVAVAAGGLAGWAFGIMDDRGVGGAITRSRSTGELHERRAGGH
jgi:hypothetical protein